MVQYSNSDRVMEARDHFKNGASSKSLMSREKFKITQMFSNLSKVIMILITSMLLLTSCINFHRIQGDGTIVSQERTSSEFYGITIDAVANVNIQPGDDYKVVVTTDNNLQEYVLVEAKNDVLYIKTKPNTNYKSTKLIVDVHLPELRSISLKGVGNAKLSDGNASSLEISLSGVGSIDAQNYQVQDVSITHSGVGSATIWAANSLSGTLSGVGKIFYKGNPTINVKVSGVGKVNKL